VKVIERLRKEADVQGGVILDFWNDERAVNKMMTGLFLSSQEASYASREASILRYEATSWKKMNVT
jgi:hypothetical protein